MDSGVSEESSFVWSVKGATRCVRSREVVDDEYGCELEESRDGICGENEGRDVDDSELVVDDLIESREGRDEEAGVSSQIARKSLVADGG